jgi:hypothetical protein
MRNAFRICPSRRRHARKRVIFTPFFGAPFGDRRSRQILHMCSFVSPHPLIIEFSARCPGPDLRGAERIAAIVTKHRFS